MEAIFQSIEEENLEGLEQKIRDSIISESISKRISIKRFYKEYLQQKIPEYKKDKLEVLVQYLLDIKIELLMISNDFGKYNYYINKLRPEDPKLAFNKVSIYQNIAFKSRVVLEKIMNFIYFLEEGEKLQEPKSGPDKGSKKRKFFKWAKQNKKWNFLTTYKKDIDAYELEFRTPEVHWISRLKRILPDKDYEVKNSLANRIGLLNCICENVFFSNMMNFIEGKSNIQMIWRQGMVISADEIANALAKYSKLEVLK